MKITCQSCQSKYTVSDEKVQGKTVKIRCRKCGSTILVNSGGVTNSGIADPVSMSYSGAADVVTSYLVNVKEGDQRTMMLAELVAAYRSSVITADTYVWAEGMVDWQPLGQVEAIVATLNAAPVVDVARKDAVQPVRDPFGGDVSTSAPAQAVQAPHPPPSAGRSDENSMLFSLSALTAKASPAVVAPRVTTSRDREDSGVIDLKALTASVPSMPSNAPAAAALPDGGLFSVGESSVPPLAAASRVVAPSIPPPKSKAPLFIGLGMMVALAAVAAAVLTLRSPAPPAPAPNAAAEPPSAVPTVSAAIANIAAPAPAAATALATAEPTVAANADAKGKPSKGGSKAAAAAPAPNAPASKGAAAPAPAPAPAGGSKKGNCGCTPGDLMCAMKCSAK